MKSTQDLIEDELLHLCKEGNVEALMLFNAEGIPMAMAGASYHYDADGIAALSTVLNQSAEMTEEFSDEEDIVDEISLRTCKRFRIVSRPFQVGDTKLILVAIMPHDLPYRKITSIAIQKVQQLF